jgi:photosystem II stability/assembly factor-like uncharacterized protein
MTTGRAILISLLAGMLVGCLPTVPDVSRVIERNNRPPTQADARSVWDSERRQPVGPWAPDHKRRQQHLQEMPRYSSRLGRWDQEKSLEKAANWEFLGPGNIGGRTRSLVVDFVDPATMYAGGVTGGVWKTSDAGSNWQPTTEQMGNINIASLAMDPNDQSTVYAGTGLVYLSVDRPYSEFAGDGILVTRDGAQTWTNLASTQNPNFRFVTDLLVSPLDSERLYAATITGVWRSNDGGDSWQRTLEPLDSNGQLLVNGCNDLELIVQDDDESLLAACGSRTRNQRYHDDDLFPHICPGDCEGRLFRNDDPDSDQWQQVLAEVGMGRIQVASAPTDPDRVYAVGSSLVPGTDRDNDGEGDYELALHAVFRSTDGGQTWQARVRNSSPNKNASLLLSDSINANLEECNVPDSENTFRGQAWYDLTIAVDPTDEDVVWVGGIDLYRSDDGGLNWGQASYWWLNRDDPNAQIPRRLLHADQHLIVFHPSFGTPFNRTMYVLNDGGVWMTNTAQNDTATSASAPCNPLESQVTWSELNNNYGVTQFYHGQAFSDGTRYFGGTQDNGTIASDDQAGTEGWFRILGGDGAYNAIHPTNPNILYASLQGLAINKSTDGGQTFNDVSEGITDSGLFIRPYILDEQDGNTLYFSGPRLWRTTSGAANWVQASANLGDDFEDRISALALAPSDNNRLYFANRRGVFRNDSARTSDASSSFPMSTPRLGWPSSIAVHPDDSDSAYVSYSTVGGTHIWRTSDAGASWQDVDGAGNARLPDIPVHSVVINPLNPQVLYAGTEFGVFVTNNQGYTWAQEITGFNRVITNHLQFVQPQGRAPLLFAFTHGRGAWRVSPSTIDAPPPATTRNVDSATSGLWFNPDQSGHGFVVETIQTPAGDQLLVYWFAFLDGQPVWIGGVGALDRAVARIPVVIASGAEFPPDFSASDVILDNWGTLTFSFTDDDSARVTWNSLIKEYGNGSLDLSRLTRVPEACVSGAWFNPDQNGHGLLVELTDVGGTPTLVVVWFVYVDGVQTWLIGTAPFAGGQALLNMELLAGGQFPPNFDPDQVQRSDWGSLEFRHLDDDESEIEWSSGLPGFSTGQLDLQRLSTLSGHACP